MKYIKRVGKKWPEMVIKWPAHSYVLFISNQSLFGLLSSSYLWTFVSLFFFNFYIPFLFGIFFLFFLFFISFLVLFQFFFNSIAVTHLGFFKVFFFIIIPPCYCRNNKIRVYFCIYKMTLISKWSYIFDQQSE